MDDVLEIFKEVEATLKSKRWFKKEGWLSSTYAFPAKNPEAVTFHVFKKHWFNAGTRGIHIESFLYLDPRKRKKSSVHIHFLHEEQVEALKIKRIELSKPIVDAIYDEVRSWPGYKFRVGKYGMQPFSKVLDGAREEFAAELGVEIERLCLRVGPRIDSAIEALA